MSERMVAVVWVVLVLSLVGNAATSLGALPPVWHAVFGVASLVAIVVLVTRYVRARR
jgi:nicotinamide riboside transporter PnuC